MTLMSGPRNAGTAATERGEPTQVGSGADVERLRQQLAAATAQIANLQTALVTARRIGMAMGVLMASRKVTEDGAVDLFRHASQHTGRKVRDLAEDVIRTGTLD